MMRFFLLLGAAAAALYFGALAQPCAPPITWRLGDFDERFGLPRDDVLELVRRAEAIWEDASGLDLFEQADDGGLPINLFYDARQMTAQENARRRETIESASESADSLKARYDSARKRFEAGKRDFLAAQKIHEERVAAHNRDVAEVNARGGAVGAQLAALRREEAAIEEAARIIEDGRLAVNELADRANRLSDRYNALAGEVNANVAAINTTAGREFKQGRFVEDASGIRIDIYEFIDREDLVHVLAHELGHALGLDHNDDPDSIMYGVNSSRTNTLTDADSAALRAKCRL